MSEPYTHPDDREHVTPIVERDYGPQRCGARTRGGKGRRCQLREGHSGHHSAHTYDCDGCGQTFRGRRGFATGKDAPDDYRGSLNFCLPCAKGLRK